MGKFKICKLTNKPHYKSGVRCCYCWNLRQRNYMKTKLGKKEALRNTKTQKGSNGNVARSKVRNAIRYAKLPKASLFICSDCYKQADVYDHRDYLKPYSLEPVCNKCNVKRGPGLNNKTGKIKHLREFRIKWQLIGSYKTTKRSK